MASASEIFRTPAAPYAFIEAKNRMVSVAWIPLLIVVGLLLLSGQDLRFLILAMIIVCVVYPMLLLLAWLKLTGSPEMTLRLHPQRWKMNEDGDLEVEFFRFENPEDSPLRPIESRKLTKEEIESVDRAGDYYVLRTTTRGRGRLNFYLIPSQIINENPHLLSQI